MTNILLEAAGITLAWRFGLQGSHFKPNQKFTAVAVNQVNVTEQWEYSN